MSKDDKEVLFASKMVESIIEAAKNNGVHELYFDYKRIKRAKSSTKLPYNHKILYDVHHVEYRDCKNTLLLGVEL